jgi:hypothetical protein
MKLTLLINDNDQLKLKHISPDGNKPNVLRLWNDILQSNYSQPRVGVANLYGVEIDDYEFEQPELVGVLKGHVKLHNYEQV